jgi:hypothetical protein
MRKKRGNRETFMIVVYSISLLMISFVLLWNIDNSSYRYWVRVGVVVIAWSIFLLIFTPFRIFANKKILKENSDNLIILFIIYLKFSSKS